MIDDNDSLLLDFAAAKAAFDAKPVLISPAKKRLNDQLNHEKQLMYQQALEVSQSITPQKHRVIVRNEKNNLDSNQVVQEDSQTSSQGNNLISPTKSIRSNSTQNQKSILPLLSPGKRSSISSFQQEDSERFQNMVYNRKFILNIDNQVTNRINQNYIKAFYQELTSQQIITSQRALTQANLQPFDTQFKSRANSVILSQTNKIKQNSQLKFDDTSTQITDFNPSKNQESIIRLHSLPPVRTDRNSILKNLNESYKNSMIDKYQQLIQENEKQKHRKEITQNIIGLNQLEIQESNQQIPFQANSQLEKEFLQNVIKDNVEEDLKSRMDIQSTIYKVMEDNYEEYSKEFQDLNTQSLLKTDNIKQKLRPSLRKKFETAKDFAETSIQTSSSNDYDDFGEWDGEEYIPEPERNFDKLRARIKLKAIKKFQEDETKKKQLELQNQENKNENLAYSQKKRKKHEPIKRRRSFTECQLRFEDGLELYEAKKGSNNVNTLTDKATILKMKSMNRFPIPEKLQQKPQQYWLKIDSIIHSMYNVESLTQTCHLPPALKVPKNSDVSENDVVLNAYDESDEDDKDDEADKKTIAGDTKQKKIFDLSLIEGDSQLFNIDYLTIFPHKAREGDVPYKLLIKPKIEYIKQVHDALVEKQKEVKGQYSIQTIQEILEHYCTKLKVPVFNIQQCVQPSENNRKKFSLRGVSLSENLVKVIALTLPYFREIYEAEFQNCKIADIMSTTLLFACFANPHIQKLSFIDNPLQMTFNKTFQALVKENPNKIIEINFTRSFPKVEILASMSRSFQQSVINLNLSGCPLGMNATRVLNSFLLRQLVLKELNLSRCSLSAQSARYIIDAVNRNLTIRHLFLNNNDFSSSLYEFSVKVASMLTRHPTILHADFSSCGWNREETMFVILAMSCSKSFLSLHISNNDMPYYDRIFVRSLIAARVQICKREEETFEIRRHNEINQVLQLASGELLEHSLRGYLAVYNYLDDHRQGLNIQIDELIKEIDLEKHYTRAKHVQKLEDLKPDGKLIILINKMRERAKFIRQQQKQLQLMQQVVQSQKSPKNKRDFSDSPKYQGSPTNNQGEQSPSSIISQKVNPFAIQNDKKQEKEQQAAEQALQLIGANNAAYDLLIENPMTGYMTDVIFSRILGHDDIEQGNYWTDTTVCYICQKWEKATLQFDDRTDVSSWSLKILQIKNLQKTIQNLNNQAEEAELVLEAKLEEEKAAAARLEALKRKELEGSSDDDEDEESQVTNKTGTLKKSTSFQQQKDKKTQQNTNQKLIKLNLKQQDENQDNQFMNQTSQSVLRNIGPDVLSPKYGGNNGMTTTNNAVRKMNGFNETGITKRSKINSKVDQGVFSAALDKASIGQSPHLEREDTPEEKADRPVKQIFNTENPIGPRENQIKEIQSHIFPEQFINITDFEQLVYSRPQTPEEIVGHQAHDQYSQAKLLSRYGGPPGGLTGMKAFGGFQNKSNQLQSLRNATQILTTQQNQQQVRIQSPVQSVAPSSILTSITDKRLRGQPQKIQRTLFFGGMVYVIEEEVYSDSDNSSVYTSEDDFETELSLQNVYKQQTEEYEKLQADILEQKRIAALNPVKTAKELRLEKLGIIDESKRELTQAQKDYRTKLWPKFYIPQTKQYKAEQLDLVGRDLQLKIGGIKQGKRTIEDRGPAISSGPLDDKKQAYLMASFNDWLPYKLKTKRELTFEKLNPDEPIPKATFVLDNLIYLFGNYVPPGKHYFYFVKEEGSIILSPAYSIVRFKSTNIFLNMIEVKPRIMNFDAVNIVKGGDDDEVVFIKDRSVFKDYKDDNKAFLRKCFDQDIVYTKIQRTVKGEEEVLEDIKEILFKNFVKINNIFLYYIGISTYPTIGMNDFTSWAQKCNMVDGKWINLAALDRILITTNVALHGLISSAERDLNRYEFLEIIVRLSNALYKESKVCQSTPQAVIKLLNDNVFPNSKEVNGEHFRRFQCYNVKVNEILQKNESVIRKLYDQYTHNKKKFVTITECRELIRKVGLDVSEMQVGVIFAESMQTIVDTIIDQERPNRMVFVEFCVFLCRVTYEHYRGSPYENELMYLKLEKLLPKFLDVLYLTPIFLFGEEFEYKPMVKKNKKVAQKVQKKKKESSDDSSSSTESKHSSDEEESSSEDDLGECIVLEEGKFKLSLNFIQKMEKEKIEKAERKKKRLEEKEKKEQEKLRIQAEKEAKKAAKNK